MTASNARGKTTPDSTPGSFAPHAGRTSRVEPDDEQPDSQCENCGLAVFYDTLERVWRHSESESEGCGSNAPDGDDGTSATPRRPSAVRPPRRTRPVGGPGGRMPANQWTSDDGSVTTVRSHAGVAHDGPNGEPARVDTYPDGTVVTTRMQNGVITDGVHGEPAVEVHLPDGPISTFRYQAGKFVQ